MKKGRNPEEQGIIEKVFRYDQGHIFNFWEKLKDREKDHLVKDIQSIDFELLNRAKLLLFQQNGYNQDSCKREIQQPDIIPLPQSRHQLENEKSAYEAGAGCIGLSKAAALTAAGGQSSRLGLNIPKGVYTITPVKNKSLFQIHAEKILFMQQKYHARIPWIIMVSETNRDQTADYFQSNDYFGIDSEYIRFIEQGMFPAIDEQGKILLREKYRIFLNPNGHGGTFSALNDSGALSWLKKLGVEEIFYFQVDNVLVKILDPVFIGYHILKQCGMSSKCVHKEYPNEKVGVFVVEDGKTTIIEYSELFRLASNSEGINVGSYTAGSIAIHILNVDFAVKVNEGGMNLPLHLAHKAIPYTGVCGEKVEPEHPNGYKIETFIFDALKKTHGTVIMEVKREDEFSPLKNKAGDASPETAFIDQLRLFARWFEKAGITVPCAENGMPVFRLEVSPLFASMEEDFVNKIDRNMIIDRDTYIG